MKFVYFDTKDNIDIYLQDSPEVKVRATFIDEGDVFLYLSCDREFATYINRVIDPKMKPHIYFASNLEAIEDEEQFQRYASYIMGNTNYQAQHKDEIVDGTEDGTWTPSFSVGDKVEDS